MKDSERITQLQTILSGLMLRFKMVTDQLSAHELLLSQLIQLVPTTHIPQLLDTLQKTAATHQHPDDPLREPARAAYEYAAAVMNGAPPEKNMRDILKVIPGGKSDS